MPMRQLRTCDFCGDDAAGVYEVLPPELSPSEAEQHRVVLCSDCLETLEAVIEPLLGRLGVDSGATDADTTGAETESGDTSAESRDAGIESGDADAARSPPGTEPSSSETDPSSTATESPSTAPDPVDSDGTDHDDPFDPVEPADPPADGAPTEETDADGAVQWNVDPTAPDSDEKGESSGADTERTDVPGVEPEGDSGTSSGSEDAGGPDDDAAEEAAESDGPTSAQERGGIEDEPDEFRTVMRLLGNREFPVERADIVELAASAYELEESQVELILDYAVERGVLADEGGTLRKA